MTPAIVFAILSIIGVIICLMYIEKSYSPDVEPSSQLLFLEIQLYINRAHTPQRQRKAQKLIDRYIEKYGMTSDALKLQSQLHIKKQQHANDY